jgi:hypothetical protein
VAYWARGANIEDIIENIREDILINPGMSVDDFYNSLKLHSRPLWPIGHFNIITPYRHNYLVENMQHYRRTIATITQPHVLDFYEPRHPDGDEQRSVEELLTYTNRVIEVIQNELILFGEDELAKEIGRAFADSHYSYLLELLSRRDDIFNNIPNVTTESIEEGKIARLTINSFMPDEISVFEDGEHIRSFFHDIHDYEHLIIDLRANAGGSPQVYYDLIMAPLISESIDIPSYAFFIEGEYVEAHTIIQWSPGGMVPNYDEQRSISEILEQDRLTQFNYEDRERLTYGFPLNTYIEAGRQRVFGTQATFEGKIWLLTDPLMTSAAQIAAWASKESGFATLVGDITGGVYGGPRTYVSLPNSGILFEFDLFYVTDSYGRPLEAGTIPHYFNFEGMDALETALTLIRSM